MMDRGEGERQGGNGHQPEDGATQHGQSKTTGSHRHGNGGGDPNVFAKRLEQSVT